MISLAVFLLNLKNKEQPLSNTSQTNFVAVFNGEINQNTEMLCNARDLHKFLGVGRDFSNWIKSRIKEYGFVKNLSSPKLATAKSRQQVMIDYHITLDMAKELAMVEKNAKGREIRRYFIDCEKKAHSLTAEITQTSILLKNVDGNLSEAGRYLAIHGKQTKPTLKAKLSDLLQKAQPFLPFVEFKLDK